MEHFYIAIAIAVILGVLGLKYLKGDFDYTDEVIRSGNLVDEEKTVIGSYYIIQRTYKNGRIKIIKTEV